MEALAGGDTRVQEVQDPILRQDGSGGKTMEKLVEEQWNLRKEALKNECVITDEESSIDSTDGEEGKDGRPKRPASPTMLQGPHTPDKKRKDDDTDSDSTVTEEEEKEKGGMSDYGQ